MSAKAEGTQKLRGFVTAMSGLVHGIADAEEIIAKGAPLLRRLVAADEWLPEMYGTPGENDYCQYLLYCDGLERFSVVSFVWGPGQSTPIHDHAVWGMVGVLRGAEDNQRYRRTSIGLEAGPHQCLTPGMVETFLPARGDIHRVANALADGVSVSIHVYGGNIGRIERSIFDADGQRRPFISGYVDAPLPNFWA